MRCSIPLIAASIAVTSAAAWAAPPAAPAAPDPAASGHDDSDPATAGFTAIGMFTGQLASNDPIAFDASADRCYLVVYDLAADAGFDSNERVTARWGAFNPKVADDPATSLFIGNSKRHAVIPLGCLLGATHVKLRVEGYVYVGAKKADAAGKGAYTAQLYARAGSAADRKQELADRKAAKQQGHDAQVAHDKHWDKVHASEQAYGCCLNAHDVAVASCK
jgi:hypothetical protein